MVVADQLDGASEKQRTGSKATHVMGVWITLGGRPRVVKLLTRASQSGRRHAGNQSGEATVQVIHLSIHSLIQPHIHSTTYLSNHTSIRPTTHKSNHTSIQLYIHPIPPSSCVCLHSSISISIHLLIHPFSSIRLHSFPIRSSIYTSASNPTIRPSIRV